MKFQIPFTFSSIEILRRKGSSFAKSIHLKKDSHLIAYLKNSDSNITAEEYLGFCYKSFLNTFLFLSLVFSLVFFILGLNLFFLLGPSLSLVFCLFVLINRMNYPRLYNQRKTADIERNLIPAMQDMLVQLNSGVPIFNILNNISLADYGILSKEFRKAVSSINSGMPQVEAIEDLGNRTNSTYFRRMLWQISNGMRAGSDMTIVVREGINDLTKEQEIQIQNYGNKLNPIIMFYMLLAVIMPALGITFLAIIASMLNISNNVVQMILIGLLLMISLFQIMFLGIIRTRRPSLL